LFCFKKGAKINQPQKLFIIFVIIYHVTNWTN